MSLVWLKIISMKKKHYFQIAVFENVNVIIMSFTMMLEPSEMDIYHLEKC